MSHLIQIGNSMGVRIPKPVIQEAGLADCEIKMQIVEEGVLLIPISNPREGWEEVAKSQTKKEKICFEGGNDFDDKDWKW